MRKDHDSESRQPNKLVEVLQQNKYYVINLAIAMLGMGYDITLKKVVREGEIAGSIKLGGLFQFFDNNFSGDIINAFGGVFAVPVITMAINNEIQKSETVNETVKMFADKVTLVMPYIMAILFVLAANDAETLQRFIKSGTPDPLDITGAIYGTAVALWSSLKFRNAVYPRK